MKAKTKSILTTAGWITGALLGGGALAYAATEVVGSQRKASRTNQSATPSSTNSGSPGTSTATTSSSPGPSGSSSTSSSTASASGSSPSSPCNSPYGCDPKAPAKSCPSGYVAKYANGQWYCQETTAEEQLLFQQQLSNLGPEGEDFSATGPTPVSGMSPSQEASTVQKYLEQKYGGTYVIVNQGNNLLISPEQTAAANGALSSPEISASTLPSVNASELNQAIASAQSSAEKYQFTPYTVYYNGSDYFVVPQGGSVPSGASAVYSTTSGTTSAGQTILNQANSNMAVTTTYTGPVDSSTTQDIAQESTPSDTQAAAQTTLDQLKAAIAAAQSSVPAGYTGYRRVYYDGAWSDVYYTDGVSSYS